MLDGQPVSAAVTNPAFINKNQDDTMANKLSFTRAGSGASIDDIQAAVNKLYTATGASESTTGTVYNAPAGTIIDGDSHETALSDLADKFDAATGHMHTGAPGDAPPISGGFITDVPFTQFVQEGSPIFAVTGSSWDVTSLMTGKVASTGPTDLGVITTAPENKILLAGAASNLTDSIVDSTGNIVYGRLTESAGTWTLTFYSLQGGVETSHSFSVSTNLTWFYRELFAPLVNTPVYEPNYFEFDYKTVKSVAVTGNTGLYGNIVVAASAGVSVIQSGQNLIFTGSLSDDYPQDVAATGDPGVSTLAARSDHAHQGIHSVAASGYSALYGDVIFGASGGISLSTFGQNLFYTADLSDTTPQPIAATGSAGTSDLISRDDHVHAGVHSVAASGYTPLLGDITLQALGGMTIGATGNVIGFESSPGTTIAASGYSQLTGDVVLAGSGNVTITQSGQVIYISASGGGGGTGQGPLITPNDSSGDLVMETGYSTFWPYLNILGADTFTVQSGAQLVSAGVMAVSGTLDVATGGIAIVL